MEANIYETCMHDGRTKSRLDQSGSEQRVVTENYRRARRWTRSAEIRRFSWPIDRVDRAGGHINRFKPAGILDLALSRHRRWIRPADRPKRAHFLPSLSLTRLFLSFFPVGRTGWVAGLSGLALRGSARAKRYRLPSRAEPRRRRDAISGTQIPDGQKSEMYSPTWRRGGAPTHAINDLTRNLASVIARVTPLQVARRSRNYFLLFYYRILWSSIRRYVFLEKSEAFLGKETKIDANIYFSAYNW